MKLTFWTKWFPQAKHTVASRLPLFTKYSSNDVPMFQTPGDSFFPDFLRVQNMVQLIEGKLYRKWPEGKRNWFELAGVQVIKGSSYRG